MAEVLFKEEDSYCYLSVHSKIAEVFANPSKQKIPAAKNHLQKPQAGLALPRCSSTVFLSPQSHVQTQ